MGGDDGEVAGSAAVSCTLCVAEEEEQLEDELEEDVGPVYGMAADVLGYGNGSHDRAAAI